MTLAPSGVIPAIPTPFSPDGSSVDEAALRRIVRHVLDGGVTGIMTTGGTGEFPHLSREERRRVTEVVVSETAGAVPILSLIHISVPTRQEALAVSVVGV
jgi:4-hydroxy-tetrahydrodipicolinate synthase